MQLARVMGIVIVYIRAVIIAFIFQTAARPVKALQAPGNRLTGHAQHPGHGNRRHGVGRVVSAEYV